MRRFHGVSITACKMTTTKGKIWREKGLLVAPKSESQGSLAVAAREFVEGLRSYQEVRRFLAAGRRPGIVARFVLEERGERPGVTFNSVKKYLQVYRRFFIPPIEIARVQAEQDLAGQTANRAIIEKLEEIHMRVPEIEKLWEAAIEDPPVIVRILTHLGLPTRAPPRAPAQGVDLFQTI